MSENDSRTALLVHTHGTPVSIRPSRQREAASGRQVEGHGQLRTRHGLSGELSGELSRSYPLQVRAKHRYTVAVPAPLRISRVKVVVNDILTARRVRQTLRESRAGTRFSVAARRGRRRSFNSLACAACRLHAHMTAIHPLSCCLTRVSHVMDASDVLLPSLSLSLSASPRSGFPAPLPAHHGVMCPPRAAEPDSPCLLVTVDGLSW